MKLRMMHTLGRGVRLCLLVLPTAQAAGQQYIEGVNDKLPVDQLPGGRRIVYIVDCPEFRVEVDCG